MKKRIIAISLILVLSTQFAACGKGEIPDETSAADSTESSAILTTADLIGFEKEDNGGKTFTIYADSNKSYEYDAEEITGEVVSDAVYAKNKAVEEHLGINFNFMYERCDWDNLGIFHGKIINDIASGDGQIDLVSSVIVVTSTIVQEGYFLEGNSLEYCNFENPWWLAGMYEKFAIAGKLYGFIGDASLSLYKDMTVLFFNKRIWDEFNAPNPYELVRNNEWILDKFLEVCSDMSLDLNGDGSIKIDDDQLTFLGENVPCGTWQTALELKVVDFDKDRIPQYIGLNERLQSAFEKLQAYHTREDVQAISSIDDKTFKSMKTFANGSVATLCDFIYTTEYLRDMKDDYGIIPIPKYDENQEHYHAQIGTSSTMMLVPVTTSDTSLTSKVMEALTYYGRELVIPKYYEVALKEKYARDDDIKEMLDIIRSGATFDLLYYYLMALKNTPNQFFRFYNTTTNLASSLETNRESFMASLDSLTEMIKNLTN